MIVPIILTIVLVVVAIGCLVALFLAPSWWKALPIAVLIVLILAFIFCVLPMFKGDTAEVTPAGIPVSTNVDITIVGCQTEGFGKNPNSDADLIFKLNPYPGVACEYEYYSDTETARIEMPAGQAALVQDWALTCPTGAACEGTWVATSTFDVPAGWLVHMWVYNSGYSAAARFPTFACEYVAGHVGHSNANIRVAPWALESGSVFDHPGCPLK